MREIAILKVLLHGQAIGQLIQMPDDKILFNFFESYLHSPDRPVLSQSFYDTNGDIMASSRITQTKAPPYFSNLLPEGPLRVYLSEKADLNPSREFGLLQLLGQDLPGAIELMPDHDLKIETSPEVEKINQDMKDKGILKFSLAGVQLKFSAIKKARAGLTIPAHGTKGDWIVKLPSLHFPQVVENEYAMLNLAKHIGIEVPEIELVSIDDIQNLPDIVNKTSQHALAIKRFDRGLGKKIHSEDFAQTYALYPNKKYGAVSYGNIAKMLNSVIGEHALAEFIKRLVFTILIANGDMHLKNWSLLYKDRKTPSLAPAYDYVSTKLYLPHDKLALSIAGEKDFSAMSVDLFDRFSEKNNLSKQWVRHIINDTVEKTVFAWKSLRSELPLKAEWISQIEKHLQAMAVQLN